MYLYVTDQSFHTPTPICLTCSPFDLTYQNGCSQGSLSTNHVYEYPGATLRGNITYREDCGLLRISITITGSLHVANHFADIS